MLTLIFVLVTTVLVAVLPFELAPYASPNYQEEDDYAEPSDLPALRAA